MKSLHDSEKDNETLSLMVLKKTRTVDVSRIPIAREIRPNDSSSTPISGWNLFSRLPLKLRLLDFGTSKRK
ncbi:MAG: hypothetical protein AAFX06_32935 [Planctomycetota bacterium]